MTQVLVVESDRDARAAIGSALTEAGYTVLEADTGVAALTRMAASAWPLVVVLDSHLPDLDSTQIVRFAGEALRPGWTVGMVLLTSDTSETHPPQLFDGLFDGRCDGSNGSNGGIRGPRARRAQKQRAPHMLAKPFDRAALLAAVQLAAGRLSGRRGRIAPRDAHDIVWVESYG